MQAFGNASNEVRRLAQSGARRILWGNLPPLYATPWAKRFSDCPACMQAIQDAVAAFNQSLHSAIPTLEAEFQAQGLTIYEVDSEGLFNDIVLDASRNGGMKYGITNVSDQASDLDFDSDVVDACLFWDDVHPTSHVHAILAAAVYSLLTR